MKVDLRMERSQQIWSLSLRHTCSILDAQTNTQKYLQYLITAMFTGALQVTEIMMMMRSCPQLLLN